MRNNLINSIFGDFLNSPFLSFHNVKFDDFPKDGDPNFNKTEENVETQNHIIKKELWVSLDGSQRFERSSMHSKHNQKLLKEPTKEDIKLMLEEAVEKQDFEKAIELRDKLNKL